MTSLPRLSRTTIATVCEVAPPEPPTGIGIVHFGVGAFARSHVAVFTADAATASGDTRWGILAVTGRRTEVVNQLRPQDCLFGVMQKDAERTTLRIIGSIVAVASPVEDSPLVVATLAAPSTHIVTMSLTEKGYLTGADGRVMASLPAVVHDLGLVRDELDGGEAATASQTAIGLLIRGLARRYRTIRAPITVLSCDNVVRNGVMVRDVVLSLAEAAGGEDGFVGWLSESVRFPSTMVDRITPAVTEADRVEARRLSGLRDDALVVSEPFGQWVIEDDFAGPHPAWERAGAIIVNDVAPFELAKLRILNATHTLLAYTGSLAGYDTIASAVRDPRIRAFAIDTIDTDLLPTLPGSPQLDVAAYRDEVLHRFENPALAHGTAQIATDGSHKIPQRILGAVADRLEAGRVPIGLAGVVAAWMLYIAESNGRLDDPLADRLTRAVGSPAELSAHPAAAVDRLLGLHDVFEPRLARSPWRDAVIAQLDAIRSLVARDPE